MRLSLVEACSRPLKVVTVKSGPEAADRQRLRAAVGALRGDAGQATDGFGDRGIRQLADVLGRNHLDDRRFVLLDVDRILDALAHTGDDHFLDVLVRLLLRHRGAALATRKMASPAVVLSIVFTSSPPNYCYWTATHGVRGGLGRKDVGSGGHLATPCIRIQEGHLGWRKRDGKKLREKRKPRQPRGSVGEALTNPGSPGSVLSASAGGME